MGLLFGAMYYVVQTGAFIARRTGVIAVTMGIAATANILFNIILIPRWGILGAAYATALGDLIALVVLYALAQRIARIPYQPVKLILSVFSAGVVVWGASLIRMHSLMAAVLWKISLIAGFIAVLLIVRAFRLRDLVLFAKSYASMLQRKGTGA
jgi:O-antigen/teichoic acid export membrane protein